MYFAFSYAGLKEIFDYDLEILSLIFRLTRKLTHVYLKEVRRNWFVILAN